MDPHTARMHYLRHWFALDFLSAFPWEVFDLTLSSVNNDEAMLLRIPRLFRLLRVSFAFRYLYRWGDLLPVSAYQLRMVKLVCLVLLFVHVNASL